ncbi:MAG: hypothetical protein Q7V61_05670 [Actinomycetota bacterium]|nr:hypothetical protein [Actinomycetota bacterium]
MKVSKLMEKLSKQNPDLPVMCYVEDELEVLSGPVPPPFFDVVAVHMQKLETHRDDDGIVRFHWDPDSAIARDIVLIEMTTDI